MTDSNKAEGLAALERPLAALDSHLVSSVRQFRQQRLRALSIDELRLLFNQQDDPSQFLAIVLDTIESADGPTRAETRKALLRDLVEARDRLAEYPEHWRRARALVTEALGCVGPSDPLRRQLVDFLAATGR